MITSAAYALKLGNLPSATQVLLDIMAQHLYTAENRLRAWVGDATYDTAEAAAVAIAQDFAATDWEDVSGWAALSTAEQKALQRQVRNLANAESWLALSMSIAALNTVLETGNYPGGIHVSGGLTDGEQWDFLRPSEVKQAQLNFLEQAETAARPYLASGNNGGLISPIGISYAYDDDGDAIDPDYPESKTHG